MRAVVFERYGEPDVLAVQECPVPRPAANQVSIRVAYAGVNYADTMTRRGHYHVVQFPAVPGFEVSGFIHELGEGVEGVTGLHVGQKVAALTLVGGYAEFALASAALTIPLDDFEGSVDLAQAAAFSIVGVTAYNLLADVARVRTGETVLIHAAAGGVGSIAVQMARALGAGQVIGVVGSVEKVAYARALGYDHVVLRSDFVREVQEITGGRGVDIILDAVGEPVRSQNMQLLAPLGRLVVFGNAGAQSDRPVMPAELLANNRAMLGYSFNGLVTRVPDVVAETVRRAFALLASGQVRVESLQQFPLEQAVEVHRLIESGQTTGKLLLRM